MPPVLCSYATAENLGVVLWQEQSEYIASHSGYHSLLLVELHDLELNLPIAASNLESLIAPEFGADGPRRYAEMALINLRGGMINFSSNHPRAHMDIGYDALEARRYWPDNQEVRDAALEEMEDCRGNVFATYEALHELKCEH